ncbi:MAG: hypothetical protein J7L53_05770 [Deltaproteobacteria bacterium]|nr:hypothetical protein [Deltaproteobacteria bacterium]
MAIFIPKHKALVFQGTYIAEHIIAKGTKDKITAPYDIKTLEELSGPEKAPGTFAKLLLMEGTGLNRLRHYRICLQDDEILRVLYDNKDIDMLAFIVYILTHELIHIQRFFSGKADFSESNQNEEEIYVDNLTRVLLAKHSTIGIKKIFNVLDKIPPPPLYECKILIDNGGSINAYL